MILPSCVLILFTAAAHAAENWPQFRGGSSACVVDGTLPDRWDAKTNIAWSANIPGRGWSSPVVWGNRVFVTSVVSERPPTPRPGLYIQDLIGKTPPGEHRWMVYCLDFQSGKILWERQAHKGDPKSTIHLKNSYASETPVTDGERVYVYFGNLGVFCYGMDGQELWSRKVTPSQTRMGWGTGASPVVHKDRLILVNDNEDHSFISVLDVKTGKELWHKDRDEKSNWATPFIWENKLRTEIVTPATGKVRSYDLEGNLLWELGGMSSIAIPTPSANQDFLFITSGYILDARRPLFAIRPGAMGDISLKGNETSNEFIAWCQKLAGPYHPSPVVYGDHIYVLLDKGFLSCYEARTGKQIYDRQRIDANSDKFTASPWAANGKIYCLSEDGDTFVIKAGPNFEVLAKNSLDEMALATPALVRGNILLRTMTKLYRIGPD